MEMAEIYMDNAATTQVDPEVAEAMAKFMGEEYGNASSEHQKGIRARQALEQARSVVARSINAKPGEIIFTSGGTESNNLALKGTAFAGKKEGKDHIITTKIEHPSILRTCEWLEGEGFKITYLGVDGDGFVDPKGLEKAITKKTIMFSVIHGNNEIGTIQDLSALGKVCRKKNILFHTDACQSYTKTELDVEKHGLDLVTLNAHKIYGPKGVGALYVRKGTALVPLQHGGTHERGLRAGTENIPGIAGFAKAVELAEADTKQVGYVSGLRDRLISGILREIPDTELNGPRGEKRLPNNVNMYFKGVEGEALACLLDGEGTCVSTGSACSSMKLEPSHVLLALGMGEVKANGSLRITLGRHNTEEEVDRVVSALGPMVKRLRDMSPLYG
ncbi:MAG: cysteine desulfurase family protein [Candidatus Bilamarchaeaceae archaeon]